MWKDWLQLAAGHQSEARGGFRDDPNGKRLSSAYRLLYIFNELFEDTDFLVENRVVLFESLVDTRVAAWWGGFDWTSHTSKEYRALYSRAAYIHDLVRKALGNSSKVFMDPEPTRALLASILRFAVIVLETRWPPHSFMGTSDMLYSLNTTIAIALKSECSTRLLLNTLVYGQGTLQPPCIQLAQARPEDAEVPYLSRTIPRYWGKLSKMTTYIKAFQA